MSTWDGPASGRAVGLNLERARELLREMHRFDPDAVAREGVIHGSSEPEPTRGRAVGLVRAELLRDPVPLTPGAPPGWLIARSRTSRGEPTPLFDSRVDALAGRVVDDVLAQGVSAARLVAWLESRQAAARRVDSLHRQEAGPLPTAP